MTNEEMKIQVAEAMGWTKVSRRLHPAYAATIPQLLGTAPNCKIESPIPNYPADLNACAQFQDELKNLGVFSSYLSNLALVCGFNAQGDEAWFKLHAGLEAVYSATARQRCLAYLKTKGIIQ